MQIKVLGCSGGISAGYRTTSFLVDNDILIDCGTGVGDLSLPEMSCIRHVFLTHTHLDHLASLPMLVDTLFPRLQQDPLRVYAQADVITIIKNHIFNWEIWPDFFELPKIDRPVVRFHPLTPGEGIFIGDRSLTAIPVNHNIPAVAYCVQSPTGVFAFTGDTTTNDTLWAFLNQLDRLDLLFAECAVAQRDMELARLAHHYCPMLLAADLQKLVHTPTIGITHMKVGEEETILAELQHHISHRKLIRLKSGDIFDLK